MPGCAANTKKVRGEDLLRGNCIVLNGRLYRIASNLRNRHAGDGTLCLKTVSGVARWLSYECIDTFDVAIETKKEQTKKWLNEGFAL